MALTILLADDSVPAQNMGKKILSDAGYEVLTVGNGLEALRKLAETVPDIAILDIFMPGYSGLEICQKLRASAATAALPVILTVGKLEPYRPEDGESVHSNAVIVKPFAAAELISAVRSLIGGPPAAVAAAITQPIHAPESDPFSAAAVGAAPSEPLAFDSPGTGSASVAATPAEDAADEPLFSFAAPAVSEFDSPSPTAEPSAYSSEPLPSGSEWNSPDSLVFNPDAEHTPFSASVTDLLPPGEHPLEENAASPFTEFDIEPSSPYLSAETQPLSPPAAPISAADIAQGIAESPLPAPDAVVLPEQVASVPSGAVLAQSSPLDIPALDPLFELTDAAAPPSALESNALEAGAPSGQVFMDDFPAPPEEVLTPEEEARRKAFEDLFNSSDLPPLEDPLASAAVRNTAATQDMLPNIAGPSHEPFDVQPDSELEPLESFKQPSEVSAGLDPYLLEEEAPRSVVGAIPERDVLLDSGLETGWQGSASTAPPTDELLASSGGQFGPEVADSTGPEQVLMPAYTPETKTIPAEAHAVEAEPLAAAKPEEIAHTPPAIAPEEHAGAAPTHTALEPHLAGQPHSILPEFAELGAGAGLAAALPALAHLVEAEVAHAVAPSHPVTPEPLPEPVAAIAESAPPEPPAPTAPVEAALPETITPEPEGEPMAAAPVSTPAPAAAIVEPLETVTPVAAALEPVVAIPEPMAAAPEPVAPTPEPMAATPEPVVAIPEPIASEPEPVVATPEPIPPPASVPGAAEPPATQPVEVAAAAAPAEGVSHSSEAERVHQAVERVFDRFKPLLVAAIVRELARRD